MIDSMSAIRAAAAGAGGVTFDACCRDDGGAIFVNLSPEEAGFEAMPSTLDPFVRLDAGAPAPDGLCGTFDAAGDGRLRGMETPPEREDAGRVFWAGGCTAAWEEEPKDESLFGRIFRFGFGRD